MAPSAAAFVALADTQAQARYVYGGKEPGSDVDPKSHGGAFDCSGLVTWALARLGVPFPDGSANQFSACARAGLLIPVAHAEGTPGALLFLGPGGAEHVVIVRGGGLTIEARGAAYGVGSWSVYRDAWTAAGLVPGLDYSLHPPAPLPSRSAFVIRLQLALGMKARMVDGIWGPITDSLLRRLSGHASATVQAVQLVLGQVAPQLVPDGKWGSKTQAAYLVARARFATL